MVKHLFLVILLTFVTGLATGIYTYFVTQDTETEEEGTVIEEESGYEVLVTVYGGCSRIGCASFRLLDDGSYQYLAPEGVRDYARYEDMLSERQHAYISNLITSTSFDAIQETVFSGTCPVTYDGIAYRFDIRDRNERYSFDSCVEDLDNEPLFLELVKYIDIMKTTYSTP